MSYMKMSHRWMLIGNCINLNAYWEFELTSCLDFGKPDPSRSLLSLHSVLNKAFPVRKWGFCLPDNCSDFTQSSLDLSRSRNMQTS
jgi:hypothetical protein